MLTQDPIGLAGGVNLYAYAGSNPVGFRDPFGLLEDVVFGGNDPEAAKRAYLKGRAQLAACAEGSGCGADEAAAARQNSAYLDDVENDHSIRVTVSFGTVRGRAGVVVHPGGAYAGGDRTVVIDPATLEASGAYDLPSAVVHEVVETSGYERAAVPSGVLGYPFHANGVSAEDGSLMGGHMPSRTRRSPLGDNNERNINGQPQPIAWGCR